MIFSTRRCTQTLLWPYPTLAPVGRQGCYGVQGAGLLSTAPNGLFKQLIEYLKREALGLCGCGARGHWAAAVVLGWVLNTRGTPPSKLSSGAIGPHPSSASKNGWYSMAAHRGVWGEYGHA